MRVSTFDLTSGLILAVLTALLFTAPSGQVYAQSRSFQMALWAATDGAPGVDTDIASFYDGAEQPPGPSILIRSGSAYDVPISANDYDWSRIVAILFDEPYNDFNGLQCWGATTVNAVENRVQALAERAAELKAVAPLTRFWVNLVQSQLDWLMTGQCVDEDWYVVNVNRPYIDVISVDIYYRPFYPDIKRYYDRLEELRAKPDQQMALFPGTFYRQGKDNPATQASYLQGFFDYASNANQSCNLPYGSRGRTGHFDGCPVWLVMGWLSHNHMEGGVEYVGERDPRSAPIAYAWQAQVALPLRPDLAHQVTPAQIISGWLPLLLN